MMIKLAIIGVVLLGGSFLLYPESLEKIGGSLPAEAQPVKENVKKVRDDTAAKVNTSFDRTVNSISEKFSELKQIEIFPEAESKLDSEAENLSEEAKETSSISLPG